MPRLTENCVNDILRAARIEDVIGAKINLKRSGSSLVGTCPFCDAEKKLSVSKAKDIWKCFVCDKGGLGPISFLTSFSGVSYYDALISVATQFNVSLEYENNDPLPDLPQQNKPKREKATKKESFRDIQLRESGLTDVDQKYKKKLPDGEKDDFIEMDRYQKGSIKPNWSDIDYNGDDMVMHYMDLHGSPMKYYRKGFSKEYPLIRVRYSIPDAHLDASGRPMKYQSPYGSGTHIWINQTIRNKYESKTKIKSLFIQEGEKKADKATKHGIISVGIMGIHNIASNKTLPQEFLKIIRNCDVENIVFTVDSDFLDISSNITNPIDQRAKSFLRAILNFHDYFYALNNSGISLNIYFSYIRNEHNQKGIDDLLLHLKGNENLLLEDFDKTMLEVSGVGKYVNCHKITGINEYKLRKDYFHLGSNQEFAKFHYEKLKDRSVFKIGRELFKFTENGELILAQPLSEDEFFWDEKKIRRGENIETQISFKYVKCIRFLNNRRFGRHSVGDGEFNFIKVDENIVQVVKPIHIKDYLHEFTRYTLQKEDVLEMLYKGGRMYLSDNLNNLDYIPLQLHNADKGIQYLYFSNKFWCITSKGIEEKPIVELDGHVWKDSIKEISPKFYGQLVKVNKTETGKYKINFPLGHELVSKCDLFNYILNTSNFHWRTTHDGLYKKNPPATDPRQLNEMEIEDINMHFISKCCAIGFLLHTFFNPNIAKCVVAMDGKLTEVGQSHGRSGKSLFGDAIAEVLPTVKIPGKQKDLTDDKFLYDGVTEQTRLFFIDDVRVNFDFEAFFSNINGYWKINPKGGKPFTLRRETSPKILITTNHALNGEGGSFKDRQFVIAFSDYYNEEHRPIDEHGCLFFHDWDNSQWSLFYNFMASCLQIYFEHGLIEPPMERIEQRKLRQQIGENFIDWADSYYDESFTSELTGKSNINSDIPRTEITNSFHNMFPESRKYIGNREVKKKLQQYCRYRRLMFNPGCKDGIDKRNGVEYFTVANDKYQKPF